MVDKYEKIAKKMGSIWSPEIEKILIDTNVEINRVKYMMNNPYDTIRHIKYKAYDKIYKLLMDDGE